MAVTIDTLITDLGLTTQAAKYLDEDGITTVGQLLTYRRFAVAEIRGMGESRMADLDRALHPEHGTYGTCTACPTCADCGMPRAMEAKYVVTDWRGRAKHVTAPGDPCDICDTHHRQLVATAALAA